MVGTMWAVIITNSSLFKPCDAVFVHLNLTGREFFIKKIVEISVQPQFFDSTLPVVQKYLREVLNFKAWTDATRYDSPDRDLYFLRNQLDSVLRGVTGRLHRLSILEKLVPILQ